MIYTRQFKPKNTFEIDSMAKQDGMYICVPCGYKKRFRQGDIFPRCFSCLKKKTYNGDKYIKGLGLWELLEE